MDPLAKRVAFKFEYKETKQHKVERLMKSIRDATGLSKGMSESIADAVVRGRDVEGLAVQKSWPITDGTIEGPSGTMTVDEARGLVR